MTVSQDLATADHILSQMKPIPHPYAVTVENPKHYHVIHD
jgi:hypothetical protein